jgi:hypothetical protein
MIDSILVSISANPDPVSIEESSNATPLEKRSGNICANLLIDYVPKQRFSTWGMRTLGVCKEFAGGTRKLSTQKVCKRA